MSGWRSALVALAVGLAVLVAGYLLTNRPAESAPVTTGGIDASRNVPVPVYGISPGQVLDTAG